MRSILPLTLMLAFLLAGCESLSTGGRGPFGSVPPKIRLFDGDLPTVSAAARQAFKRLDCVLTDVTGAPGRLEASSPISTSKSLGDSRQLVITIRLHEAGPGRTEVEMLISLQVETATLGGPTAQDMREHGFYDAFFTALQQVLQERVGDRR